MANETKEKMLDAALEIFSRNGYAGTNLKEIAGAVGVVKSAFYRHYESKEEVWNAVIDRMEAYYEQRFGSSANLPEIPQTTDELKQLTLKMLDFTVHDRLVIMTRKLLLTEQFHDDRVRSLATEHFGAGLETLFSKLFAAMMENGSLMRADPGMLAFSYVAPITSLVHLCDREPDKVPDALKKAEAFMDHFISIYGMSEAKKKVRG